MKTVGTKLGDGDFSEFLEQCNEQGCTISERLRNLIQKSLEKSEEIKQNQSESISDIEKQTLKPRPLKIIKIINDDEKSHYDSFGNYWTFDKNTNKWTCHVNGKNIRISR